ncbi:MAG: cyanoexosortase B system-associated protein [Leptolyngbyaceae cyanobacterium SL_1_1]|nr:cyanoexosortase B system-associated protein [Leptolyngbyaceae cyanobacterium SL_1_1]
MKLSPRLTKGLLVLVLAGLVAVAALPNYLGRSWPWVNPPQVAHIEKLQALSKEGISVANWKAAPPKTVRISGHDWLLIELEPLAFTSPVASATLLLRPQPWHNNQPEVEWIDLTGSQNWQVEALQDIQFTAADSSPVEARFFRGRNDRGTFAVLQWYAWSKGGHYSPNRWFIADQVEQWRDRQRLPWVAVCLLTSMEPLSSLKPYEAALGDLASQIQASLQTGPLA